MGKGTFTISCPLESYIDYEHVVFGAVNADIPEKKVCMQSAVDVNMGNNKNCSNFLDHYEIRHRIATKCSGYKQDCTFDTRSITKPAQSPDGSCGNDAFMFVQAPCLIH